MDAYDTENGLNVVPMNERMEGHRPLECVQQAGDILFIPSMWSHLTINIGETIAIGGQEALQNEERLAVQYARTTLKSCYLRVLD